MDDPDAPTAAAVVSGLRAVQAIQGEYDRAMWDISEPALANVRHIHLHLAISLGRLAQVLEPRDHAAHGGHAPTPWNVEELSPVIADLVMHAAQLATTVGVDLGDTFTARYRQNAARFAANSRLAKFGTAEGEDEQLPVLVEAPVADDDTGIRSR